MSCSSSWPAVAVDDPECDACDAEAVGGPECDACGAEAKSDPKRDAEAAKADGMARNKWRTETLDQVSTALTAS